jgi:hypothetical protein
MENWYNWFSMYTLNSYDFSAVHSGTVLIDEYNTKVFMLLTSTHFIPFQNQQQYEQFMKLSTNSKIDTFVLLQQFVNECSVPMFQLNTCSIKQQKNQITIHLNEQEVSSTRKFCSSKSVSTFNSASSSPRSSMSLPGAVEHICTDISFHCTSTNELSIWYQMLHGQLMIIKDPFSYQCLLNPSNPILSYVRNLSSSTLKSRPHLFIHTSEEIEFVRYLSQPHRIVVHNITKSMDGDRTRSCSNSNSNSLIYSSPRTFHITCGRLYWLNNCIELSDIVDIRYGTNHYSWNSITSIVDSYACFTIITKHRTLCLESKSEDETLFWIDGLTSTVNAYSNMEQHQYHDYEDHCEQIAIY